MKLKIELNKCIKENSQLRVDRQRLEVMYIIIKEENRRNNNIIENCLKESSKFNPEIISFKEEIKNDSVTKNAAEEDFNDNMQMESKANYNNNLENNKNFDLSLKRKLKFSSGNHDKINKLREVYL